MKTKRVQIKDLKPGMKIKTSQGSTDIFKEVTDVWNTEVKESDQVRLEFTNGIIVNCSVNHPIMVMRDSCIEQVKPQQLTNEDDVISENGKIVHLISIDVGQTNPINYVDITVEDTHTFFAADSVDSEMILTHNSQGGVRGGAATLYFPFWHAEVDTILNMKNNKGTEETAVRQLDYGIQMNKLAFERLITGGDITLFSPHEVKDMHDAFFEDQDLFKELYEKYERNPNVTKTTIPAIDLFTEYHTERKETGRIYRINVDHANSHGAFIPSLAPIRMSNLCAEIALPTKPLEHVFDETGEIALCTLAAYNVGKLKKKEDMERPLELLVRALNEILDYQDYPLPAAKTSTMKYRPLGVGAIGVAHWLAKNDFKYSDGTGLEAWNEIMEAYQFYLTKASMELAKERGTRIPGWDNTKYSQGLLPIDTYKKEVDDLVTPDLQMDWEWLRGEIAINGIMNATLSAGMPSETSSQIANETNGFEPPRSFVSVKGSGEGRLKQVVPGFPRLKNKYELLWDQPHCRGYLNICAVSQKYFDQSISTNTFYNPENYTDDIVPMSVLIQDDIYAYQIGLKTMYYCNTYDGQSDEIDDDEDCLSCKI